ETAVAQELEREVLRSVRAEDDPHAGAVALVDEHVVEAVAVHVAGAVDPEAHGDTLALRALDAGDARGRVVELAALRAVRDHVDGADVLEGGALPQPIARD